MHFCDCLLLLTVPAKPVNLQLSFKLMLPIRLALPPVSAHFNRNPFANANVGAVTLLFLFAVGGRCLFAVGGRCLFAVGGRFLFAVGGRCL
ncbi:hypothetical protein [Methanimicrococcus hongohii]|uniref:hypothetical protein n=1 Tax=Methanimicrococcus hongohii TaxID=3028295 RepID=UPI00292CCDD4|nr:hypothetical protein [Methanimicrococcus sp. Hf6]